MLSKQEKGQDLRLRSIQLSAIFFRSVAKSATRIGIIPKKYENIGKKKLFMADILVASPSQAEFPNSS